MSRTWWNIFHYAQISLHLSVALFKSSIFKYYPIFFEAKDLVLSPSTARDEFLIKVSGIVDEQ